jgi:putative ABC transport system permease protein
LAIPLKYNLRNLVVRRVNSLMTVFTIALVVAVSLALMSLANGLNTALVSSGAPSNAIVMRESAQSEVQSIVTKESYQIIQTIPGIARDSSGKPITSGEVTVLVNLPRRQTGEPSNVTVRGVSAAGFSLRPQIKLVDGKMFRTGVGEAIVSRRIANRFASTGLGDQIKLGRRNWTVVGIFEAGNTAFDSEIWADVNEVMDSFDRADYSSVLVRAADGFTPQQISDRVNGEQRLKLEAKPELKYYEEQTSAAAPIRGLGMFVAIILGIGACFGGMNTMYAAVAARTREVGTLRALGFSKRSIMTSFVIESLILALIGGVVGCLLALPVNGVTTGTTNFRTFSELAFSFQLSPELIGTALIFAAVMGLLGGFLPARAASRLPITTALRQM